MDARNTSDQPLRLHLGAGQLLASVDSTIVVLKSQTLDFAPRSERHDEFPTVATSAANKVAGAEFHLSSGTLPDLDKLFAYVAAHPEASPAAVQQGLIQCQWRGNGKDLLFMDAQNTSAQPLSIHLAAGQLLASEDSTVVLLKSQTLDFAPHGILHGAFPTVATSSANKVIGAEYHLSAGTLPDLDKLFAYVAAHPEARPGAIQTTALILTENLPLSAFARFNELSGGVQPLPESQDFKADTVDILEALTIVKDIGIDRPLAVTIDPQLEVEAMIDPAAHDLAVRYYGITDEWAYWKNQLLQGDPSTRHYALYGIARFYPDVALEMLPKWARGAAVSPVFRMSAVEALAETNRPEAIPVLRELERELGATTDLGRAAHQAANFLDSQFARTAPADSEPPADTQPRHSVLASAGN